MGNIKPAKTMPASIFDNPAGHIFPGFDFSGMVGLSEPIRKILSTITKVAETRLSVMLSGQSGTGKEVAAQAIHANSSRKNGPFVTVNCGAIPENLMESEFFGHAKGAFSGADRARAGLFETASFGTLFLDEIGDLPLPLQVKLLRVLEERRIRRLGETVTRPVDFRLITASNQELEARVRSGNFRADLYFRINVIHLIMPPLIDRPGDIPLLAKRHLSKIAQANNIDRKSISESAMELLQAYHWPGNVRELFNVIEQAMVMSDGPGISPSDLPLHLSANQTCSDQTQLNRFDLKALVKETVESTERELIEKALALTGQNRTRAAKKLGISRRALITKIQNYHLGSSTPELD